MVPSPCQATGGDGGAWGLRGVGLGGAGLGGAFSLPLDAGGRVDGAFFLPVEAGGGLGGAFSLPLDAEGGVDGAFSFPFALDASSGTSQLPRDCTPHVSASVSHRQP